MLCFPNAKINLGLYVTHKRADGYHNIETVFYPVAINDVLEIIPAKTSGLHQTGLPVTGADTDNLVWKACRLLAKHFPDKVSALDIYLHKVIPMGAGMGGGSADGAFMLRLLNNYCKLQLTDQQLANFALQLGSDCPFFIYKMPGFASGRGEQLSAIPLDLSAYSIQLVCPKVHVATGAAFQMITPQGATFDLRQLHTIPVSEWKEKISNDFEAHVFEAHPALTAIKRQLYDQGAIYASMSGSGSAIYGIFPKSKKAIIIADIAFEAFYVE